MQTNQHSWKSGQVVYPRAVVRSTTSIVIQNECALVLERLTCIQGSQRSPYLQLSNWLPSLGELGAVNSGARHIASEVATLQYNAMDH
jgi:hypothetical protein